MFFKCATHAPASDHGHAQTVSNGNKHFTVDIHCHVHVPEADAMLPDTAVADQGQVYEEANELTSEINRRQHRDILPKLTDAEVRIADMDASGIDVQAISPAPFHYN